MSKPRGVRNNNPGNIDRTRTVWQGEDRTAAALASEARFAVFTSAAYGFRAIVKILMTYQNKHGLRTVAGLIGRWAPPSENDTAAYVAQVSRALGVEPDTSVDVGAPATAFQLVKSIARHENGGDFWPDQIIWEGLRLAGIKH
ncbi:structural protein P5 [Xanthomonas sacchari]|uniref:structural protein P5 n=1 Tax=Xanthomonas sacchari TaxID=56458 RepID=UPI00225E44E2|nr:structural protein P5 [Xanthomonas sacchari]UYK82305.1 structural protein P5 [Xanthomonas sacchari]